MVYGTPATFYTVKTISTNNQKVEHTNKTLVKAQCTS